MVEVREQEQRGQEEEMKGNERRGEASVRGKVVSSCSSCKLLNKSA
jgi:hypothetical protein